MSIPALAALAIAGAVALVALAFAARQRRRASKLADRVADDIAPYLLRRAAEQGLVARAPVFTARTTPEEKVEHAARLAIELVALERAEPLETSSTALAQTVPGDPDAGETAPMRKKKP